MVLAFRSSAKKTRSNLDMSKDVWATDITVTAIHGFPLVSPGCDVVEVMLLCLSRKVKYIIIRYYGKSMPILWPHQNKIHHVIQLMLL